ncbi:MAG: ABC transporter permease [Desulfobacteraceae bacterium]|nr:MAG: ABC transporter permease [Desulfobacteraceae bacterium]
MKRKTTHNNLPVVEYTPDSSLRNPLAMFKSMWKDLLSSKELALRLMSRDIKAQYRQSIFGILWAFIPPVATAFVFIVLNQRQIFNIRTTDIPYPVFVMFGTVLWAIFVESLNAPIQTVAASHVLLTKITFPKEALILSGIGKVVFNAGIKLLIIFGLFVYYRIPISWGLLFALLSIVLLILLGTTIGLALTPLSVLYQDIIQMLTVVTGLWFFITPVVYPPPVNFPFTLLSVINPVSPILIGIRDMATEGTLNNPIPFFSVSALMLIGLLITWVVFRLSIPILVERISS